MSVLYHNVSLSVAAEYTRSGWYTHILPSIWLVYAYAIRCYGWLVGPCLVGMCWQIDALEACGLSGGLGDVYVWSGE